MLTEVCGRREIRPPHLPLQADWRNPEDQARTPTKLFNKCWQDMSNDFTEIQVDFSRGVSVLNLKALSMLKF